MKNLSHQKIKFKQELETVYSNLTKFSIQIAKNIHKNDDSEGEYSINEPVIISLTTSLPTIQQRSHHGRRSTFD